MAVLVFFFKPSQFRCTPKDELESPAPAPSGLVIQIKNECSCEGEATAAQASPGGLGDEEAEVVPVLLGEPDEALLGLWWGADLLAEGGDDLSERRESEEEWGQDLLRGSRWRQRRRRRRRLT